MKPFLAVALIMAYSQFAAAGAHAVASPEGLWFPPDRKAAVEIVRCGASLCGRIVWIDESRPPPGASGPPVDGHNPDPALRTRRLCGLEILRGFASDGPGDGLGTWRGGTIYNPEDGEEWRAQISLEGPDALRLRGYVLIPLLGKTQIWTRAQPHFMARCAVL